MDIRELGRLDLNLLVALEALLEERSVSRAAQRLFITQSAMSKTLGRLRELFDDPLFVRRGSGMIPTPRAEQLAARLPQVLLAVQGMFAPASFDPAAYVGQFNLLVQGHMGVWLLPMLLRRLEERAPGIRLATLTRVDDPFEQLSNGKLDFLLQAERQSYPGELRLTTIGYAPPTLLARKGHPLEGQEITWERVLQFPHVQLSLDELREIQIRTGEDSSLMKHLRAAVPNLQTDQLYTAVQVVRQSDYLFPAPPLFMEQDDISKELIALPLPEGEEVTVKYVMVNHERVNHSAPHEFLYREMLAVIDIFRSRYDLPPLEELRKLRMLDY
ncbi:MAG: LysR family transcriptional regulator [Halieaceae bacterium]|nr:LysR family transcriptional regulator [Halieaceae bacterium]